MYMPREKLLRKFWVILLALMVLLHMLILPVSAAVNVNENILTVNRSTMKTAPIRAKEIEGPIPNPQYEYYLNHKEEFTNGYIPPKYIFPEEKTRNIRTRSSSEFSSFKKYDSRSNDSNRNRFSKNIVTPRKDQFNTGTCWAHADLSVVETLLKIKYGNDYDLSEGHMAYNIDNMTDLQSGGGEQDPLAYYARLSGPVLESNFQAYSIDEDNPKNRKQKEFDSSRATLLPEGERDTFKIMGDAFNKKLDFFVTRTLELDLTLENLKRCIYENGSVAASYFITYDGYNKFVLGNKPWDDWIVKLTGVCYHYVRNFNNSKYLYINHTVALIGWDDDKEITNSLGEKAKGAFLVKNSIPAPPFNHYDDFRGYHWISYESFLGNKDIVPRSTNIITARDVRIMDSVERASLKNVYNPCKLTNITFNQKFDIKGKLNKAINVYERGTTEPETIKYVTYYNKSEGSAPYKIYITEDPELLKEENTTFADGTKGETLKDINSDKWVELASGTFTEKGYQTLEVIQPYTITSGKFALKIETKSKTLGLAYRSFPSVEKLPASSYMYNDENPEHFFQKIDDAYKIFLGTVTVKPNEYTVTVTDDGNGTATANPSKGPKGTKVTIKAVPNPGYEFDKWEIEGATAQDPQASETTITIGEGNVTAKAIFKKIPAKEYKVSFETTYGTKPEDQKVKENEKATAPAGFEKDKTEILDNGKTYVFKGWFLGTEEYNFETEVKEDKKLTAKWEEKIIPTVEYKVSFETTYGTKPEDQKIKEGEKAKAPTGFEKDTTEILDSVSGKTYIFKGWFIGTEEYNFETEVKEDKKLTAKWEEKIIPIVEYTVTVTDDGNGTATANPSKGPKGTKVTIKAVPKPDYEFDKWEVEGATAQDPKSPETTLTIGEGNATAKAVFKKAIKVFDPAHVETMVVKTQPTKLIYKEGDNLALAGLVVTLTDNQGLTKYVAFADFVDNGITAEPANDTALTVANHNGKKVTLTKGNLTVDTNALTVNKKDDLTKYKEKAKEEIDKLSNLTNQEKKEFKDKVDEQVDKPGVDKVVEEAKAKNDAKVLPPTPTPTPTPNRPYWPDYREEERPYRPHRPYRRDKAEVDTKTVDEEKVQETNNYDKFEAVLFIKDSILQKSVNGVVSQVRMDIAPFIYQSRTMLPIRFVAESLGFMVSWDAKTKTVYLSDKENIIQIPVETNNIIVNGNTFVSDVKPMIKNNRTMLPVANVARALGLEDGKDILWDAAKAMVTLRRNVLK